MLEVLAACEHPTKSALVERDLDLIAPMAAKRMARVFVSVTTLNKALARTLEPRAAAPHREDSKSNATTRRPEQRSRS